MPILPIPSIKALITKGVRAVKTTAPKRNHQRHVMHYILKKLGRLPMPLLERLNHHLKAPTAEQYPHADAHLRLIIAINNKLKRPLHLTQLLKLRERFATEAVAMQSPKVWQQSSKNNPATTVKLTANEGATSVSWQDKAIANADGGDMTIRCYQSGSSAAQKPKQNHQQNPDNIIMLFFHGGGFCIGDINTHHEFCHAVCTHTGWAVVSVDYRLAPEYPAPTALRDCLAAYAWSVEHGHTLGASPSRIVLAGDSAGGCLAILTAQQITAPAQAQWLGFGKEDIADSSFIAMLQNLPRPLAQLPLYPMTDIAKDYPSWALYGQGLLLDHNDIAVFDTAYLQDSGLTQTHALISPMYGDNHHMCPSYIVAAELDVLRDEALAYAKQLQAYGIKVKVHTVLGAPHGFIHLISTHQALGRETNYVINEFETFVRQLLSTAARALPAE